MTRQRLHCHSPLAVAIALIGNASDVRLSGSLSRYSACRQQLHLTNLQTGDTADVSIVRAASAARVCHVTIDQVTTTPMKRQVIGILRAFVRETQAPIRIVLASQAA